jgi:hypothetical protein
VSRSEIYLAGSKRKITIVGVQVFDAANINVALASSGATASQSFTYTWDASCIPGLAIVGATNIGNWHSVQ